MRIKYLLITKKVIFSIAAVLLSAVLVTCTVIAVHDSVAQKKDFIKWVDFKVTDAAMEEALGYDISTYGEAVHINWIEILAVIACGNGGDFSGYKNGTAAKVAARLSSGETASSIASSKYYDYYFEAYTAALGGFVGEYEKQTVGENGSTVLQTCYGVKVFSPIAKNYPYSHYDDFGNVRTYGFSRTHLGNDLLGQVGTPIVAVESGVVEVIGWNKYGGWRIGIRSLDSKRYYYYAHLRKGYPYKLGLEEGNIVEAGDVIGYMGRTGYSDTEDTNNIETPHLHFGMELIFDESQKECDNEIWIDVYEIVNFLESYKSAVEKIDAETKDYSRIGYFHDLSVP